MADLFNILNTVAGQATTSPSSAAATPLNNSSYVTPQAGIVYRVVTDSYLRLAFGTNSSVTATTSSLLFAPGEVYVAVPSNTSFYSAMSTTGTANYSISTGNVANVSPVGY